MTTEKTQKNSVEYSVLRIEVGGGPTATPKKGSLDLTGRFLACTTQGFRSSGDTPVSRL